MNNLEIIKAAFEMNYGAIIDEKVIVAIGDIWILGVWGETYSTFSVEHIDDFEITGYKYMGELGGNGVIPEKFPFKIKKTGEIKYFNQKHACHGSIGLSLASSEVEWYDKSEIEPHFYE